MSDLPNGFLLLPPPNDRTMSHIHQKLRLLVLKTILKIPPSDVTRRTSSTIASVHHNLVAGVRTNKSLALRAVGHLDVITPTLAYLAGAKPAEDLMELILPTLMLRLFRVGKRELVTESMLWEKPLHRIIDEHMGLTYYFDNPIKGFLVQPTGAEVLLSNGDAVPLDPSLEEQGVRIERDFTTLSAHPTMHFSLTDSNPLSMFEAHPDKTGNHVELGTRTRDEWITRLDEALDLIKLCLPTWHEELSITAQRLIPVGYEPEMHLSASYREAPGLCYLTLHPDPVTMAEAIIHETQHSKANMLSWLDPIVTNGHTCWTESPVRPDLRPLWGVLLAVHAFIPVSALHYQLSELDHPLSHSARFAERRAEVLAGNRRGLDIVIQHAEPTKAGALLIDAMRETQTFLESHAPPAPKTINPDLLPPG